MPSGTSVKGFQTLTSGEPNTNVYASLIVFGEDYLRPTRVGFLYLVVSAPTDTDYSVITNTRLVYSPGMGFYYEPYADPATYLQSIVVNWNFAGLEWELYTGA